MTDADPVKHEGLEKFRWHEEYEFFNRIRPNRTVEYFLQNDRHPLEDPWMNQNPLLLLPLIEKMRHQIHR